MKRCYVQVRLRSFVAVLVMNSFAWTLHLPRLSAQLPLQTTAVAALTPGIITTYAGDGTFGSAGNGGAATNAELGYPRDVAIDAEGNLYIADTSNHVVRKVATSGAISIVAGNGTYGYSGIGGPATSAELGDPSGIGVDSSGNIYFGDYANNVIWEVDHATQTIQRIAGVPGNPGYLGDGGPANLAQVGNPAYFAIEGVGSLYFSDSLYGIVRKISNGAISTVAGSTSQCKPPVQGTQTATKTCLVPSGLALDSANDLYIAGSTQGYLYKLDTSGNLTTVAGNGEAGFSGDGGPAANAAFENIADVKLDSAGNLYLVDGQGSEGCNCRVREIATSGIISTVGGNGVGGPSGGSFGGDGGVATAASLKSPSALTLDSKGNIYIADTSNDRVRQINVTQSLLSFPKVDVGDEASYQKVTLSNVGDKTLNLSVSLSGTDASSFSIHSNSCGEHLVSGHSCVLVVGFEPEAIGSLTAEVLVTGNGVV